MQKSIEKILVDIIQTCLNLPETYGTTSRGDVIPCVVIYNQNIKLFNTDKLQVTVRTISEEVWSNRSQYITNSDGTYTETQDLNLSCLIQIDCYSRNNDAREKHKQIAAALHSTYAQQQMDLYNFKLATLPSFSNISGIDGGSDINRYTATFKVLTHESYTTEVDYYDKFEMTAEDERGQFANILNYEE